MKVIFYAYEFHPLGGGVGKAVKEIFKQFEKYEDLEIDFITTSLENRLEVFKHSENITFHRLPIGKRSEEDYHKQKPKHMALYSFKSFLYTVRLMLKGNRYDLAHVFGYPGGLASMLLFWKIPYIVSLRGVDVPGYNDKFKKYYFIYKPMSRWIWKLARKVIANSQGLKDLANETAPKQKIEIIPNGIDTSSFAPIANQVKFEKFTVSAGGTLLNEKKGLNYLIEGFATFQKKHNESELWLYGEGDSEKELKELVAKLEVEDAVKFLGRQPNDKIRNELLMMHVFCLPSINEGMSNAALEGLAAGLPLILTNTGGTKELLDKNGIVVEKRNSVQIAEALAELYKDPERREEMGRLSRRRAEEMSWENVAGEYYKKYLKEVKNLN